MAGGAADPGVDVPFVLEVIANELGVHTVEVFFLRILFRSEFVESIGDGRVGGPG